MSMHDLIRIYSAERAATDPDDADRALRNVVERYAAGMVMAFEWLSAVASEATRRTFATPAHAAAWFEAERMTLLSVISTSSIVRVMRISASRVGVCLGDVLRRPGYWRRDFSKLRT